MLRSRGRRKLAEHWSFRWVEVSAAARPRCEKSTRQDFCRPGDQCVLFAQGNERGGIRFGTETAPKRLPMLRSRGRRKLAEHWSFRWVEVSAAAWPRCEKSTRQDFCCPGDQCVLFAQRTERGQAGRQHRTRRSEQDWNSLRGWLARPGPEPAAMMVVVRSVSAGGRVAAQAVRHSDSRLRPRPALPVALPPLRARPPRDR